MREDPLGTGFQSIRDIQKFLRDNEIGRVSVRKEVIEVQSPDHMIKVWENDNKEIRQHLIDHNFGDDWIQVSVYDRHRQYRWDTLCTLGKGFLVMPLLPPGLYPLTVVLIG